MKQGKPDSEHMTVADAATTICNMVYNRLTQCADHKDLYQTLAKSSVGVMMKAESDNADKPDTSGARLLTVTIGNAIVDCYFHARHDLPDDAGFYALRAKLLEHLDSAFTTICGTLNNKARGK